MTKDEAIRNATLEYLADNPIRTFEDFMKCPKGILERVYQKFDEHNMMCAKDEKWKKPDGLNFAQISDVICGTFGVRMVDYSNENSREEAMLCVYVDDLLLEICPSEKKSYGVYSYKEDIFKRLALILCYSITQVQLKELIERLRESAPLVKPTREPDLIWLKNGIFDYKTKVLSDFTPELVTTVKAQVAYNHSAYNVVIHNNEDGTDWDVESWMQSLAPDEPEIVNVLWEITSAILRPNVPWNKAAFLYSERGNNGKGSLCEMYRAILGEGSYASITLDGFSQRFGLAGLKHAIAIITDENDVGTYVDKAATLKSVITGDAIPIEEKFERSCLYSWRGFMVQCLNEYAHVRDHSQSFYRRQLFVPMTACFTGQERKYIKREYLHRTDVLEYVVKKALETDFYELSEPASCKNALRDFKENNNPVAVFWNELSGEFKWNLLPFTFLYELYKCWFSKNKPNGALAGKTTFTNELLIVIKDDDTWHCEDKTRQINATKDNMGCPEPLILEYQLGDWMNKAHKGSNPDQLCMPCLKQRYAGIERY